MRVLALQVNGLTCEGCASHVREILEKESGVERVRTSVRKKRVTVDYDAQASSPAALMRVLASAGYEGEVLP